MNANTSTKKITVPSIVKRKAKARKIAALTAYDFTTARLLDAAGIDIVLVGDSLGSVFQGRETTLPVTLDEMIYHSRCVARGVKRALVVGDMPFMSYQASIEQAVTSAGRFIKEAGVSAVKIEGGVHIAQTIERVAQLDMPVMGHVGLTPQSYHRMGGYRIQGKTDDPQEAHVAGSRTQVIEDALAIEKAGAFSIVLEGVPAELAAEITSLLSIPTIGIAAGDICDGQVLVTTDMLGMNPEDCPSFVTKYADLASDITKAVQSYIAAVQGTGGDDQQSAKRADLKIA